MWGDRLLLITCIYKFINSQFKCKIFTNSHSNNKLVPLSTQYTQYSYSLSRFYITLYHHIHITALTRSPILTLQSSNDLQSIYTYRPHHCTLVGASWIPFLFLVNNSPFLKFLSFNNKKSDSWEIWGISVGCLWDYIQMQILLD